MDEAKASLIRAWLLRGWHDLESARALAELERPLLDTAIYHCQQAAEKVLKGFLAYHDEPLIKTHDVRFLVQRAAAIEDELRDCLDDAELLTPYATQYRYPNEFAEPNAKEFAQAMDAAERVWGRVADSLPSSLRPDRS
jgi:HEPN domain-containing protein